MNEKKQMDFSSLRIECLEERRLLAVTIAISDVTVVEGDVAPAFLGEFAVSGFEQSKTGLIFGPDSNGDGVAELYVSERDEGSVARFDGKTGELLDVFVPGGSGGLAAPMGIAFGPDGHLYVADRDRDTVLRFDRVSGEPLPSPGQSGATFLTPGAGGMDKPIGLTFDSVSLYVTSRETDNVLRFDAATGELLQILVADEEVALESPHSLAFGEDANGDGIPELYVTGTASNNVVRFNGLDGEFLDEVVSGLDGVRGIAIDERGYIYVAQRGTPDANVLRYEAGGTFLDAFAVNDNSSWGITLGPDGNLYTVLHDGQGILHYGSSTQQAVFLVQLSEPSRERITIDFSTTNGTATAGEDFGAVSGTLVFSPGDTYKTISVPILDNEFSESEESFIVTLSDPTGNVTIVDGQGQANVVDNDDKVLIPGDANQDGEVSFADFLILSQNFGKQADAVFADGDFDGDGKVEFSDFLLLSTNFGRTSE